jgi:hypothetical protein
VLNARLYRTAWLVAGVAIVVALLTLRPRPEAPQPEVPPAVDGTVVRDYANRLEGVAPTRPPGSEGDRRSADWVAGQFAAIPGVAERQVRRQAFAARRDGALVETQNVYLSLPGADDGLTREGLVVVAARDTEEGESGATASSGMLVELARLSATSAHRRPLMFVSVGAGTIGNAGTRWFLSRFSDFKIAAVIALDAPGAAPGNAVWVWPDGRDNAQSIGLNALARDAVRTAGATPAPHAGITSQLMRLAVPQTFGEQAPAVAAGLPAVTVAGRPDRPPRGGGSLDPERLAVAGNAVIGLMGSLDVLERVPGPTAGIVVSGRELPAVVLRMVLLLAALPVVVAAVDALARLRRAGVRLRPGLRAVAWRAAPLVAAAAALHVLALAGLVPTSAAGVPPLPADMPFTAGGALALALAAAVGAAAWFLTRTRARASGAAPAAEAAAGLVVLAAVLLVAWLLRPFVLVLALPAAHAVLVATAVPRRWQVAALGGVAVLPLLALGISVGGQIERGPAYVAWYLVGTTAQGSRGALGPLLGVALVACIASIAALVVLRARKGLVAAGPRRRPRRPPRPARPDATG